VQCEAIDTQLLCRLPITFVGFSCVPLQRSQNIFRRHGIASSSSHGWSISILPNRRILQFSRRLPLSLLLVDAVLARSTIEQRNWD
jgi:hypothetical protein